MCVCIYTHIYAYLVDSIDYLCCHIYLFLSSSFPFIDLKVAIKSNLCFFQHILLCLKNIENAFIVSYIFN